MTEIASMPDNPSTNTQSSNMTKYGMSRPFTSSNPNQQLYGYIDDGYTLDLNGICTGDLITNTGTKRVTLLSIDNKPSYNLNSINNPSQILVMSKDNKYIFLYPSGSISTLSSNDTIGPFLSLVVLIFAIKKYNISIPLITDYELLFKAASNSKYTPSEIDPNLPSNKIILEKMIMLADAPNTDPLNSLDSTKNKSWSDLSGLLKTYYQLYDYDISNLCISYVANDLTTIPNNVSQFDCRNTEKIINNPIESTRSSGLFESSGSSELSITDNSGLYPMIGGGVFLGVGLLIVIGLYFLMESKPIKNKSSSSGGYYYF